MHHLQSSPYLSEIAAAHELHLYHQKEHVWPRGYNGDNSTSAADCAFLHLLIRHFQCRHVFESGTWIGTSAIVMAKAAKLNGGGCTTCDPVDCGCLPPDSGVRFIKGTSAEALATLREEGKTVDFVFFDWVPDRETIEIANDVCEPNAILATHDYKINSKGKLTIQAINAHYARATRGRWFLPEPFETSGRLRVNLCTAFLAPEPG